MGNTKHPHTYLHRPSQLCFELCRPSMGLDGALLDVVAGEVLGHGVVVSLEGTVDGGLD